MPKHWWRVIAKALGGKAHPEWKIANQITFIRLTILLFYMTTNAFICAGVIRHWND